MATQGEKAFKKLHDLSNPLIVADLKARGTITEAQIAEIQAGFPKWENVPDVVKDVWEKVAQYCADGCPDK